MGAQIYWFSGAGNFENVSWYFIKTLILNVLNYVENLNTAFPYNLFMYTLLNTKIFKMKYSWQIPFQNKILQKTTIVKGHTNTIFFVDDSITGTIMKRLDFQKMIAVIEVGYISEVFG